MLVHEQLTPLSLELLEADAQKAPERGYPPLVGLDGQNNRLHIPRDEWQAMVANSHIMIPEGRWSLTDHYNRHKALARGEYARLDEIATEDNPLSEERIAQWRALGLLVDTAGRPLHPRADHPEVAQVLTTPGFGMFTQLGFHYKYGPQQMANLGLRRVRRGVVEYAVTQVLRSRLLWGMPGGYVDVDENGMMLETIEDAAFREGAEEAGIIRSMLGRLAVDKALRLPPDGKGRDTLHAWGEEWFVFARGLENPAMEDVVLKICDPDEKIVRAEWMAYDTIVLHPDFMGTHRRQIMANEARLKAA